VGVGIPENVRTVKSQEVVDPLHARQGA